MGSAEGAGSAIAAVVFTDVVGSTELRSRLGAETAEELRRAHEAALRVVTQGHGGNVVKSLGDGIMATFLGVADGVSGAVAMQQSIDRLNRRADGRLLSIRVGMSAGDVTWEDGDCFGVPVIEASRLCARAGGGEILCSDVVRILGKGRGEHDFTAMGELALKGVPEPVAVCRVEWAPALAEFPLPAALRTRSRFPFVGRAAERKALEEAWKHAATGERQAVLLGGERGVGKTRLAAETARTARDAGGVVLAGRCDEEGGAERFDITRESAGHLAFGHSEHACLGMGLARLEGAAVLTALVERVETIEVDGPPVRKRNNLIRSFRSLPLTVTPKASA